MAQSHGRRHRHNIESILSALRRLTLDQASLLKLSEGPSWGFRELSLGAVPPGETVTCLNLGRCMREGFWMCC